ncbi:MAG: SdrD B-like domain-containing protein [Litorimonas sp.]
MLEKSLRYNFKKNRLKQWFKSIFLILSMLIGSVILQNSVVWAADETSPTKVAEVTKTAETQTETQTAVSKPAPLTSKAETTNPAPDAPIEVPIVNTTLIAEVDSTIIVKLDGETLESTQVHRNEKGALYVNATPIFASLNDDVRFDEDTKALIVRRSQDGVIMELFTDTGIVKQNGRALGRLRHFGEVSQDRYLLTANAIAVLSGAAGKFNDETNEFNFKLDPRLKIATGFEIYVNEIPLGTLNPAPRSVGPVLLLPLLPIAEELGHVVQVIEGGSIVTIRRAQDSAEFSLNLDTGLIMLRGNPIGLSKDVTYIDRTNLLLPVSAIETLTGTHVDSKGGTNRIDITLDERLAGAIKPTASVEDTAKATPFTPESLIFSLGPDSLNTVELNAHGGSFNGQLRYETQDLVTNTAELEPSWLSLNFAHTSGLTGSVGDYAADFRELDGVGLRRVRGLSVQKTTDKGRWAAVIGVPEDGARQISEDQTRSSFGGLAAGVRYADRDGWEAGLSARQDSLTDDQAAVLEVISGRLGRVKDKKLQWSSEASLGVFNGPARESSIDARIGGNIRYDANQEVSVDVDAQYDGAEFLRSQLDREEVEDDITAVTNPDAVIEEEDQFIPDTRSRGLDQISLSTNLRYAPANDVGILNNPAVSVRANYAKTGALKTSDESSAITNVGVSGAVNIGETGLSLSADASYFTASFENERENETGRQFNVRAFKQIGAYTVRAQYRNDKLSGADTQQALSVTASRRSFNLPLPKDANLSVSPSVSTLWNGDSLTARGGVFANLNSGRILGEKTRVNASFGALQSVSGFNGSETDKFLTVSVARQLRLGNNLALGLAYRNDLNGNQRVGLQLTGRYEFNEKRRYRKTEDGRGVLKGRAFLDENRDGIKQDDEAAMPRVLVKVKGTSLSLRTDNAGFFTIQNIREGIYELQIDARSLPLGFDLSEDVTTKATIADGQITDVPMPIVQRGQIRGFGFIDENGSGAYETGEERIEGAKLKLSSTHGDEIAGGDVEGVTYTSSFGQYAFDDLAAGEYLVEVLPSKAAKITGGISFTINIAENPNLMGRRNIIIQREKTILLVDDTHKNIAEQGVQKPPAQIKDTTVIAPDL